MKYIIDGNLYPIVSIELNKGEQLIAQTNALLSMTKEVEMETEIYGGMLKAVRRLAGGDSLYMTTFTALEDGQVISLADRVCGNMLILEIDKDHNYLCDRAAYLCAEPGVDLDIAFMKRIRMAVFSGEGLVLERLSGNGKVVLHGWGELHKKILGPGEELEVTSSRLLAFSTTITLDVKFVKTVNNILFSGRGLFTTHLTGPGEVYIQSFFGKNSVRSDL
jgi:uncharacterized protein (TIGR00266 family)